MINYYGKKSRKLYVGANYKRNVINDRLHVYVFRLLLLLFYNSENTLVKENN